MAEPSSSFFGPIKTPDQKTRVKPLKVKQKTLGWCEINLIVVYDAWFVPDCTWKKNVLGQGLARKPERSAFLHDSRGAVAVGDRVVAWWFVDLILFGVLIGEDIFLQWKWLKCNCAPFFGWISDQKSLSARTSGACFTLLIHLQSSKMWTTPFSSTAGCLRREVFF